MNQLGELLKNLRGTRSLRSVAEKSGLSHTYIRDLELGVNRATNEILKPSPETLRRLAETYDYLYEELMEKAGYLTERAPNIIKKILNEKVAIQDDYWKNRALEAEKKIEDSERKLILIQEILRGDKK